MKRKLEEMESENHENFGKVMEVLKGYCEEEKKKKKELEKEDKNKKRMTMRARRGGMQLVRDRYGKLIPTGKTYAEATKERLLREEENRKKKKKKKKEEERGSDDSEPEEPWEPRWSDENLALHLWRGVCRDKGVKCHEYVPRTDYHKMSAAEVRLDLLWRKVYKAEAEADAAAATTTTTS